VTPDICMSAAQSGLLHLAAVPLVDPLRKTVLAMSVATSVDALRYAARAVGAIAAQPYEGLERAAERVAEDTESAPRLVAIRPHRGARTATA
jgi:hypothetical protein